MKLLLAFLLSISSTGLFAQTTDEILIRKQLDQLFLGMKTTDSLLVKAVFHPNASLETILKNGIGETTIKSQNLAQFITAVGTPHTGIWDERIDSVQIFSDGPMGMAWAPYRFYLDDKFIHEGVNLVEFIYQNNQWLIIRIIDTRRSHK